MNLDTLYTASIVLIGLLWLYFAGNAVLAFLAKIWTALQ